MKILGIHDGHNSSAAFLENNILKNCIQEESLTGVKNQCGFPKMAIDQILEKNKLDLLEMDLVVFSQKTGSWEGLNPRITVEKYHNEYKLYSNPTKIFQLKRLLQFFPASLQEPLRKNFFSKRKEKNLMLRQNLLGKEYPSEKIKTLDHHYCHAASAYYGSSFNKKKKSVLVLTVDGSGDRLCATVSIGQNGKIQRLASLSEDFSIARLYAMITFKMGMVPLEHEYKLMGMAPYGDDVKRTSEIENVFDQIFSIQKDDEFWRLSKRFKNIYQTWPFLEEKLRFKRFDHICFSLQSCVEKIIVQWVKNWIKKTQIHNLALAGGLFMNVKVNQKIHELDEVKSTFIFPSCGDESLSIGAVFAACSKLSTEPEPISHLYLGFDSDNREIDHVISNLDTDNFEVTRYEDIEQEVARLLDDDQVVARHKSNHEFGARALGNRSILANPAWTDSVRVINDMIKKRDFWMPFALSILDEKADEFFENLKKYQAHYMIMTFDLSKNSPHRHQLSGGIHPRDFTTRPQVVHKQTNNDYHRLISYFYDLSGIPALLNTSLNLHGLPLVSKPSDSQYVLENSGLNYLALENFLIRKK